MRAIKTMPILDVVNGVNWKFGFLEGMNSKDNMTQQEKHKFWNW